MMFILVICLLLLSAAYWWYTGQIEFAYSILGAYAITLLAVKLLLRPKSSIVTFLYTLFFILYGTLVLLTQIELIHSPMDDYYVHNDAAWSFYYGMMNYVLPYSWGELYENTMRNSLFYHYPLAAFIMGFWGKLGQLIGIENLRLFMRLHIFVMGAVIIALISNIFVYYRISEKRVKLLVTVFGLFSYLYLTSAIFSRDIHVCIVYTLGIYICLKDNVKFKPFWFMVLFFAALGFRPQSGLLFLIYPFLYYYDLIKEKFGLLGIAMFGLALLIGVVLMGETFSRSADSISEYEGKSLSNTGGLFIRFYTLPFPLNTIVMVIYMTLQPLPIFAMCKGEGMTWLNLPYILSPYLLSLYILACLFYVTKLRNKKTVFKRTILMSLIAYVTIIYASPDVRRAFAAIPGLFICYGLIESHIPSIIVKNIKKYSWTVITLINVFFLFYSFMR